MNLRTSCLLLLVHLAAIQVVGCDRKASAHSAPPGPPNEVAVTSCYGNWDEPRCFKVDYSTHCKTMMRGEWYCIEGRYLEYSGKEFGFGDFEVDIDEFQGPRSITSLATYPASTRTAPFASSWWTTQTNLNPITGTVSSRSSQRDRSGSLNRTNGPTRPNCSGMLWAYMWVGVGKMFRGLLKGGAGAWPAQG